MPGDQHSAESPPKRKRYRYLLRTAPPEAIEQVYAEALAKLTDEQRGMTYDELTHNASACDAPRARDAASLAQSATRSEHRQPGTLERSFGGPSFGSMPGSTILGTVVGYVIGSAIVSAFMPNDLGSSGDAGASESGDSGSDAGADARSADAGFGDFGAGDFGDDFGGGFDF